MQDSRDEEENAHSGEAVTPSDNWRMKLGAPDTPQLSNLQEISQRCGIGPVCQPVDFIHFSYCRERVVAQKVITKMRKNRPRKVLYINDVMEF